MREQQNLQLLLSQLYSKKNKQKIQKIGRKDTRNTYLAVAKKISIISPIFLPIFALGLQTEKKVHKTRKTITV